MGNFKIKCDWDILFGENIKNAVYMVSSNGEESCTKPSAEDLVAEERSVHLKSDKTAACEITLEVFPKFCIDWITIICDCEKLEKFIGKLEEYEGIEFGVSVDGFLDNVFKYEIDVTKPNTTQISLKFLTLSSDLWIFGMAVGTKPNTNPESMFSLKPSVNFENVQQMLAGSELSPSAEKCKSFLQSYMGTKNEAGPPSMATLMSMMNSNFQQKLSINEDPAESSDNAAVNSKPNMQMLMSLLNSNILQNPQSEEQAGTTNSADPFTDSNLKIMKLYIDQRLSEMESNINRKLDKILEILSSSSK